jgi:hypothetical protein
MQVLSCSSFAQVQVCSLSTQQSLEWMNEQVAILSTPLGSRDFSCHSPAHTAPCLNSALYQPGGGVPAAGVGAAASPAPFTHAQLHAREPQALLPPSPPQLFLPAHNLGVPDSFGLADSNIESRAQR